MTPDPVWIVPDWPAPAQVRAISTSRRGGVSLPPFDTFNLGDHVGDCATAVAQNRHFLRKRLQLPSSPFWLRQVHGIEVVDVGDPLNRPVADASYSRTPGEVCCVVTADCLPLLLCSEEGQWVAAVHAGWRSLADGIVEATVRKMAQPADRLMAWLGPAIGPDVFEVGEEVRQRFLAKQPEADVAFRRSAPKRWLADIYLLARQRLQRLGVQNIYGGQWCTYCEAEHFFSYRRDGVTGRMATLIWIEQ